MAADAAASPRRIALGLTVLTGFSGLVYEVAWQKYLAILLGSHSEATAAVLGIFLAGLAAGYEAFGALARRRVRADARGGPPARLLLVYAAVEAAIGAYALLFPALFRAAQAVSLAAPAGGGAAGFGFDVVLTAALIGPPTALMGGTIPLLTQALARDVEEATRIHAWVYAFNTAGAFAGALAAGFALVPLLGLPATLAAMSALNLSAAAGYAWLGRDARARAASPAAPAGAGEGGGRIAAHAAVALLLGFAMMALQTVAIRVAGLSFGASQFSFSMVVAVFVLCIALGSLLVSALRAVPDALLPASLWLLVLLTLLLYLVADDAPFAAFRLRRLFGDGDPDFYAFHLAAFGGLLLLLAPPVLLSGAALPLLFHSARQRSGELGATAGRLYASNTLGSLLGALLGGYALLFWLDLDGVYRIAAGALLAAASLASTALLGRGARSPALAAAVAGAVVLALLPRWDPHRLASGLFRLHATRERDADATLAVARRRSHDQTIRFYRDDPTQSVAVKQWHTPAGLVRSIVNNGKSDGSTRGDYPTTMLAAVVPSLLSDHPRRAFVIGWGTGITAGVLASLPGMGSVTVAEISPAVLDAAPLFDFANHRASRNPRIRVIRSDAYRALLRSRGRFDVIVSEPSNPWVMGVEMLYSAEFLAAARERLTPGGVYAQWYHQYESDTRSFGLVLRTYAAVFDHVAVWYAGPVDFLLLGISDPTTALDVDRIARRAGEPAVRAALAPAGVEDPSALLVHELLPLGVVGSLGLRGPLHTLAHPRLSYLAAHAFFRHKATPLPLSSFGAPARIGAEHSLLRRWLARAPEPERERRIASAAAEACHLRVSLCAAWLAAWSVEAPDAPGLRQLEEQVRTPDGRIGGAVDLSALPEITALLEDAPAPGEGPLSPLEAQHRTEAYLRYYQHALPFQADRALEAWTRCRGPAHSDVCARGLDWARQLVVTGTTGY